MVSGTKRYFYMICGRGLVIRAIEPFEFGRVYSKSEVNMKPICENKRFGKKGRNSNPLTILMLILVNKQRNIR